MGYIAKVYHYAPSSQSSKPAYRGYVRHYDGTNTVTVYKCPEAHYSKKRAQLEAEQLIKQLKSHHAKSKQL